MSDWYEAVAVQDVIADRAPSLSQRVVETLTGEGIVQGVSDPESVLGGEVGYRPGPRIEELYERYETEGEFCQLRTNGMEPCIGRWINSFGFTCFDGFTCGACLQKFAPDDDAVADPFLAAIGDFIDGQDDPVVACPKCCVPISVRKWQTDPHFGFVNLAFQFWNWPSLESDKWKVSIPALIQHATGHKVILTHGRL